MANRRRRELTGTYCPTCGRAGHTAERHQKFSEAQAQWHARVKREYAFALAHARNERAWRSAHAMRAHAYAVARAQVSELEAVARGDPKCIQAWREIADTFRVDPIEPWLGDLSESRPGSVLGH